MLSDKVSQKVVACMGTGGGEGQDSGPGRHTGSVLLLQRDNMDRSIDAQGEFLSLLGGQLFLCGDVQVARFR